MAGLKIESLFELLNRNRLNRRIEPLKQKTLLQCPNCGHTDTNSQKVDDKVDDKVEEKIRIGDVECSECSRCKACLIEGKNRPCRFFEQKVHNRRCALIVKEG